MTGKQQTDRLAKAKRIVVKIGSALLVDEARGAVHRSWLEALADDIARLRGRGQEVIIVSSGAVAVGRRHLGLPAGVLLLEEKQAAAATGMVRLAHAYQEVLARHDITVAQVLLTLEDSENRRRYLNARNTLETLLRLGAAPLINENDTVATDEIRMGDNDRLSARVAAMISADALILLSDIDGLYSDDPRRNKDAAFIHEVHEITPAIESMAGCALPGDGTGGMVTKLAAARIALASGCAMVIADGKPEHPLRRLEEGARHTWFLPGVNPHTERKRWIAGGLKTHGSFTVDDGALKALGSGKSLLPAGVTAVDGNFERGDAVVVRDVRGNEIARGLSAYSSRDARLIFGHKSKEIEGILGYRGRDEMIHRDDLVLV
ncbi:MAG: glutamate 5-kinase [Rhodospirillales bacterium RIFCSPLOWO2_12_FULL_58_28]|nr:MAG: glutamate 5-kinase [Rhodospirillales bacterium RIFCSPLOWO2_02_FULL_58_16]OHC77429.1 MAG: glutamate 5-kinase [Rhodospirillales bacterium RIFCSPLOWO2_12_FULL_58_28]